METANFLVVMPCRLVVFYHSTRLYNSTDTTLKRSLFFVQRRNLVEDEKLVNAMISTEAK
jgi:hypothetical protein